MGGGAVLNFAELNRAWPDPKAMDVIAYPLSPQVHATDSLSIAENLEAQADQVWSARRYAPKAHLAVGPVTLEPRWRPGLPDARQKGLFGAAWSVGCVKMLAEAGADSITFCNSLGPRGVIDTSGADMGRVNPLFHVLADAGELKAAEILRCRTYEEPWVCAVAARADGRTLVLVANLCPVKRCIRLATGGYEAARMRVLDDSSAHRAAEDCAGFRAASSAVEPEPNRIALDAYATARVELR